MNKSSIKTHGRYTTRTRSTILILWTIPGQVLLKKRDHLYHLFFRFCTLFNDINNTSSGISYLHVQLTSTSLSPFWSIYSLQNELHWGVSTYLRTVHHSLLPGKSVLYVTLSPVSVFFFFSFPISTFTSQKQFLNLEFYVTLTSSLVFGPVLFGT